MVESFLNLAKNIHLHIWEAQQTPNKINTKKSRPKHIISKLVNTKEKEKKIIIEHNQRKTPHCFQRLDFSSKNQRPEGNTPPLLKCWKKRAINAKFYNQQKYPSAPRWNKDSLEEEVLRKSVVNRSTPREQLKEVLHTEEKWYQQETWNEGRTTEMVNIWINILQLPSLICLVDENKTHPVWSSMHIRIIHKTTIYHKAG